MGIRVRSVLVYALPLALASCTGSCVPKEARVTVLALYQVAEHYELRVTGEGFKTGSQVTVSLINAPGIGGVKQLTTAGTSDGEAGVVFRPFYKNGEGPECLVPAQTDLLKDPKPNASRGGTWPITVVMRQDSPYAVAAAGGYVPNCGWTERL